MPTARYLSGTGVTVEYVEGTNETSPRMDRIRLIKEMKMPVR
jgi:hypothetical protein